MQRSSTGAVMWCRWLISEVQLDEWPAKIPANLKDSLKSKNIFLLTALCLLYLRLLEIIGNGWGHATLAALSDTEKAPLETASFINYWKETLPPGKFMVTTTGPATVFQDLSKLWSKEKKLSERAASSQY